VSTGWSNKNRYRLYPFRDDQSLVAAGGQVLPMGALIDFHAISYVDNFVDTTLSSVTVTPSTATFQFEVNTLTVQVLVSLAIEDVTRVRVPVLSGSNTIAVVEAVFGPEVQDLVAYASQTLTFPDLRILQTLTDCKATAAVKRILAQGDDIGLGDVFMREGYNVRLEVNPETNTIRISAIKGAGLGEPCESFYDTEDDCQQGIFYINGLHPDWPGNFLFAAGSGIEVLSSPLTNTITIKSLVDPEKPACRDPE